MFPTVWLSSPPLFPTAPRLSPGGSPSAGHDEGVGLARRPVGRPSLHDDSRTSMPTRQWSLGPQFSGSFTALTRTCSDKPTEANTKSSCRAAVAGDCRFVRYVGTFRLSRGSSAGHGSAPRPAGAGGPPNANPSAAILPNTAAYRPAQ